MATIQHRRNIKQYWENVNPILAAGELGLEIGVDGAPDRFKLGNGLSTWMQLKYFINETEIDAGLTEFIHDTVAGLLKAGVNVTTEYDDAANTFTINATGSGGGGTTDPEIIRDTIGGALVAGSGISVTVNDAADTITIAVAGIPQSAVSGLTTSLTTLQTNIDAKYTKSGTGIPIADLTPSVQTTLQLANTASQPGHTHSVSEFTASGTRDGTTFLRGDNTWAKPPSEEVNVTRLLSYGAGGLNSGVDWPQAGTDRGFRRIVCLPFKTTRYRHKIRNFNTTSNTSGSGFESNGAAALVGAGMVEGVAAFDSLGIPNGNFQGGVGNTQMPSGYTIPNDGSFYVGPWITDPAQQFSPDVPKVFATGWTAGASVSVNVMTERVFKYTNAEAAINPATTGGVSGNNNGPGIGASAGNGVSGMPLDWLIEYETVDALPAVLFITDSLGEGVTGPGNAAKSTAAAQVLADAYYAYPMRFGMQEKVHVTNLGLMNSTTAQWGHATLTDRWTRTDIFAGKYDAIVIALGSNDASLSTSLASFQTQMAAVVARARQYVGAGASVPLYFVNITPRGFSSGSTQENARLAYNSWFSQLPFNAKGVVDLDSAMGTPNANTMRTPLHIDGAHYSYQGMDIAAAATSATLIPSGR